MCGVAGGAGESENRKAEFSRGLTADRAPYDRRARPTRDRRLARGGNHDVDLRLLLRHATIARSGMATKAGILKGESYDTVVADAAIAQSVDWGAALGAGRPRLSLQMIAEMFRDRDWDSDDGPDVKMVIERTRGSRHLVCRCLSAGCGSTGATAETSPNRLKPQQFQDARLQERLLEQDLLQAIALGLSNPDRFEPGTAPPLTHQKSMIPTMREAGLDVGLPPLLPEFIVNCEQVVRATRRVVGPLLRYPLGCSMAFPALGLIRIVDPVRQTRAPRGGSFH